MARRKAGEAAGGGLAVSAPNDLAPYEVDQPARCGKTRDPALVVAVARMMAEGYSQAVIAAHLGVAAGTVGRIVHNDWRYPHFARAALEDVTAIAKHKDDLRTARAWQALDDSLTQTRDKWLRLQAANLVLADQRQKQDSGVVRVELTTAFLQGEQGDPAETGDLAADPANVIEIDAETGELTDR